MSWRGDEKRARNAAEKDPLQALTILDNNVLPKALDSSLCPTQHRIVLMTFRAELLDALGRPDEAATARQGAREVGGAWLESVDQAVEDSKGKDVFTIQTSLQSKATALDALGEHLEADRTRLLAADVIETGLGESGARAERASAPFFLLSGGVRGFESAAAFRRGWESSLRAVETQFRDDLLKAGRAVAITWCSTCGGVVPGNYKKKKCASGHKVSEVRVVVTADEADERAALEAAARS